MFDDSQLHSVLNSIFNYYVVAMAIIVLTGILGSMIKYFYNRIKKEN